TAFLRIVGALGRDDATHVAFAKGKIRALLGLERMAIREPVDHRGANPRDRADAAADPGTAQDQPPVLEAVLHTLPLALVDVADAGIGRDRSARNQQVTELQQRKDAK